MNNGNQPIAPMPYTNSDGTIQHDVYSGLTKREYFAGLAMQGLLTRVPNRHGNEVDLGVLESKRITSEAIYMADALLTELEAEQEVSNG
jgi:hypothetical protein